jgi:predicted metal-dependent hydrolase
MSETIQLGDVTIAVSRKDVKNVHLSVHPPDGRVTLVAPRSTRLEVARAYAISKLGWIRKQQTQFENQARESPRKYIERETHILWGRPYLLSIIEQETKPTIYLDHRRIMLIARPGTDQAQRARMFHDWHKSLLHQAVPALIARWEPRLKVKVNHYYLQRMKTKWGSCNYSAGHIRLNTELAKKPKDLLEYVVVHEMAHLIEPSHNTRFIAIMDKHYPSWREARAELNALPLSAEKWGE